jgi:hypothetical protein
MSGLLRRIRRPSEDGQRLPAGIAPEDLERRGATGRRSRLRRRARFLRRARELALRDLGGLVYEARRREQDGGKLVEDKVARLAALDAELRGIEAALGTPRGETVIREPGVGGTCARCGELHGSDARFCSHCGVNLEAAAAEAAEKARAEEAAPREPSGGAGNGRPAVKADEAPADKADAPTTEQPATEAADARADQPTTEQPPADEPATKPLA